MRFSLQPEQRPQMRMQTVSIEEIVTRLERNSEHRPPLEHYFSPDRKEAFTKDFIHYLNTELLEAKHGNLDLDLYLVFLLTFQFISPLLEIAVQKEMENFIQILQRTYQIEDPDLNLHFSLEEEEKEEEGKMLGETEALEAFRQELDETYQGRREVKDTVQKRLKMDGIEAIMQWQREQSPKNLAEAFGRSVIIPAFFSFSDKKLVGFYRDNTAGISYRVAVPESLMPEED
jgi:hypothetical protein